MNTRCNIHFTDGDGVCSNIYRHCDGYPKGVLPYLEKFFDEIRKQVPHDTRFNSPEQLAARFLVWQASQFTSKYNKEQLDFLGVSPAMSDHGDIEYVYQVDCARVGWNCTKKPTVKWKSAGSDTWLEGAVSEEL